MKDEQTELLTLEKQLATRVVGQSPALNAIAQRLRASKTGLTPENGPQGVFLLVGPSGVGKTETALALADVMYGGEKSLITINLSEYQEPHTVSQLKGSLQAMWDMVRAAFSPRQSVSVLTAWCCSMKWRRPIGM
ncbi:type VI secretion protein ClpV [Salmonella enterica subsp. arizonae]|uniref:Type VI secretion protein ClpV n=1 Tax=Salmonella enterica subsp. arizonae TaxID=59203 RepID=A0A447R4L1_SALER|nr:type VI secretion protein ClpV [Salmonella enterica subsp. arizonae]